MPADCKAPRVHSQCSPLTHGSPWPLAGRRPDTLRRPLCPCSTALFVRTPLVSNGRPCSACRRDHLHSDRSIRGTARRSRPELKLPSYRNELCPTPRNSPLPVGWADCVVASLWDPAHQSPLPSNSMAPTSQTLATEIPEGCSPVSHTAKPLLCPHCPFFFPPLLHG